MNTANQHTDTRVWLIRFTDIHGGRRVVAQRYNALDEYMAQFPDATADEVDVLQLIEDRAELSCWHQLVTMAHINRDGLWPNNWPQNVSWIAHCLHCGSIPPSEAGRPGNSDAAIDPWRGLYDPERMPKLGSDTYAAYHPDLPAWPDDREESIGPLLTAQGVEWQAVEGDYGDDWESRDFDPAEWLAKWEPEAPGPEWRIAIVHDTEDGPAAVFVRPLEKAVQP